MRCIEIFSSGQLLDAYSKINRNMRCIEMAVRAVLVAGQVSINRNMRCIEIWVEYGCAYGTIID